MAEPTPMTRQFEQFSGLGPFDEADRAHAGVVVTVLGPALDGLAKAMLLESEVVLHDLTRFPHTIAAIVNPLTGRSVGGPLSDLGLVVLRDELPEHLINYYSILPDGTNCRSSSIFFRAPSGRVVVALCINSVSTEIDRIRDFVSRISPGGTDIAPMEHFHQSVDALASAILKEAIASVGESAELMSRQAKLAVISALEARGFFSLKESVKMASDALGVSKFTVYSYLNEVTNPQGGGTGLPEG
ncbi:helix-turn-helix transcriptional regulator [Pararhodobacter sp.]|uniref:helix-turn-helix transcriptional regulator n=1 Tax=Pararhodobacter sp. TaxID=2127056 RepID=UPI002FDDEA13